MKYSEIRNVAAGICPSVNACCDCGDVINFFNDDPEIKGECIAIVKATGEPVPFALAIEEGLVNDEPLPLDFETGDPEN